MTRDVESGEVVLVVVARDVVVDDGFGVLDLRVDEEEMEDVRVDVPVADSELPAVVAALDVTERVAEEVIGEASEAAGSASSFQIVSISRSRVAWRTVCSCSSS